MQRPVSEQQMELHLSQGVHRSVNPLYPLPFLTEERQTKVEVLDERAQDELVRLIVERHQYQRERGDNTIDMRAKALDYITEKNDIRFANQQRQAYIGNKR